MSEERERLNGHEERKHLQSHIRAAREWLGEAETSLERENDAGGRLKVMLAKAELERAGEQGFLNFPLKRLLPPAMATLLILAAFGVRYLVAPLPADAPTEATPQENFSPAAVSAVATATEPEDTPSAFEAPAPAPTPAAEAPTDDPPLTAMPPEDYAPQSPPVVAAVAEAPPVASQPLTPPSPMTAAEGEADRLPEPPVPERDMQQLMLSAGKVLRAQ